MTDRLSYCKIDGYDMIFFHDTREWWSTNAEVEKKVQDFANSLYNKYDLSSQESFYTKYAIAFSEWLFEAIAERFGASDISHFKDDE